MTVIAATVAGTGGPVVVLLVGGVGLDRPEPSSGAGSVHTQDVVLCTSYALIDAALHQPIENGGDALPAIAPLRLTLTENPDGNPQVRAALSHAIEAFDAILAKGAKPRGLSEPPAYKPAAVAAAFDEVARVCGLGR